MIASGSGREVYTKLNEAMEPVSDRAFGLTRLRTTYISPFPLYSQLFTTLSKHNSSSQRQHDFLRQGP